MKLLLVISLLAALLFGLLRYGMSRQERSAVWRFWRPLVLFAAAVWVVAFGAGLILYYGGHFRVL